MSNSTQNEISDLFKPFSIDVNNGFQLNIPSLSLLLSTPELNRTQNQTRILSIFMTNLTEQVSSLKIRIKIIKTLLLKTIFKVK